jgi:hypothetical protein
MIECTLRLEKRSRPLSLSAGKLKLNHRSPCPNTKSGKRPNLFIPFMEALLDAPSREPLGSLMNGFGSFSASIDFGFSKVVQSEPSTASSRAFIIASNYKE